MYSYRAFNLTIRSELPFPELLPLSDLKEAPDKPITIQFGEVNPQGIGSATNKGLFYQVSSNEFWLNVPNIAHFLVSNGQEIKVAPAPGIDQDSLRVFLLGSCMGALLMQRDFFLLHGNAVKIGNCCISFVGNSGAGKSTLSAAFFKRGYSILADDVCAIGEQSAVQPSFPQIKLWFDAAKQLDIETKQLRKIRPKLEKFAIPLLHQFHQEALPLKAIYILHSHNKDSFKVETLNGMQKIQPMLSNMYRKNYLKGSAKERSYTTRAANLANQTALIRITRPNDGFKLNELVDLIEQDLQDRCLYHDQQ